MTIEYRKIRSKFVSIKDMITPHLKVMQIHLKVPKELVQHNPNLSIVDNLMDLRSKLVIEIQAIKSILTNWDGILGKKIQVHKPFLDKYGLNPISQK